MMKISFLLYFTLLSSLSVAQQGPLKTVTVIYKSTPVVRTLYAKIKAKYQATISAQTSGRVVKVLVDIGDHVKKNTILLRLRATSQKTRYNAASARYKKSASDYSRARKLYRKRLVSKAFLDKSSADYQSALSELNQSKEELERTIIRAPYHGIVVKRHIKAGETARIGQDLLTGLSLEKLQVVVEVPQTIVNAIRQYKDATIQLGGKLHKLNKLNISPYADPDSHSFTVKASLPEGNFGVYPGMFIKINFTTGQSQRLLIPLKSVIHRSEVSAVYTLGEDQRITMRQVRVGRVLASGQVEIVAGLNKGDRVALDPVRATVLLKMEK